MTDWERKEIARRLIVDLDDSYFHQELYPDGDLNAFYGACECKVVPSTACCARDEARRIIGEPEASNLLAKALDQRRGYEIRN